MSLPQQCPLCSAGLDRQSVVTPHVYGSKGEQNRAFFHCANCDVRYQHPRLTPDEEARFYAAEFEGFMASRAGTQGGWQRADDHIRSNEPTRQRRMRYLTQHLGPKPEILEIGCSSGFMLFPLAEAGATCTGIEPSGVFSEFVKDRGLPVYQSVDRLRKEKPEARFDLILHFFVLEHIAQPDAFLREQLELLKPGGKIIFEVPNAADPLFSIYDIPEFERFYWSIAHPWYFSERSLTFLLRKLNTEYDLVREQRYDLSNHMIWARDGRPGGMGRFTEILGAELDDQYKKALIRSGHCDTLIGVISS